MVSQVFVRKASTTQSLFFKYILLFLPVIFSAFFFPSKFWIHLEFNCNNVGSQNPSIYIYFFPPRLVCSSMLLNKPPSPYWVELPTFVIDWILIYLTLISGPFLLHGSICLLTYQGHEVFIDSALQCTETSGRASLTRDCHPPLHCGSGCC